MPNPRTHSPVVNESLVKKTSCYDNVSDNETYIALQSVGLLSPGNIHVSWQSSVVMEESPVFGLGCQVLSLLGVADVQHIQVNTKVEIHVIQYIKRFFLRDSSQVLIVLC